MIYCIFLLLYKIACNVMKLPTVTLEYSTLGPVKLGTELNRLI